MINYHSTAAQDRLMREHLLFKFSYNFFGSKVSQYSSCAAIRTTTVRGNSNDSFCGSYLMTEFEFSCYATDNLKNVTQMTKHHAAPKMLCHLQSCSVHVQDWRVIGRTSDALLLFDVIGFAMLRETTRRTQVFLLHAMTFMH